MYAFKYFLFINLGLNIAIDKETATNKYYSLYNTGKEHIEIVNYKSM